MRSTFYLSLAGDDIPVSSEDLKTMVDKTRQNGDIGNSLIFNNYVYTKLARDAEKSRKPRYRNVYTGYKKKLKTKVGFE